MGRADKKQKYTTATGKQVDAEKHLNTVFKFNTNLGQHILKNPLVAQGIVDKAQLKPSDTVLEIGPGTGNLTMRILEAGVKKVIAIEFDPRMAAELTKRVRGTPYERNLEIILGDFIKIDPLPYFDVCISNTPYQISSPLTFKLLNCQPPPRTSILMFQREFALRLIAKPGDPLYCRLSCNIQMYGDVQHIMKVGKNNFRPPPKVESSVVRLVPKLPRPTIKFEEYDGLLRILFNRKNKTLNSNFKNSSVLELLEKNYKIWKSQQQENNNGMVEDEEMDVDEGKGKNKEIKDLVDKVLQDLDMGDKRPQKLDQVDFLKILFAFNKVGIHFA
ncbi:Dimethyladenosine transferase [Hanseniaspora vineae]